MPVYSDKTFVAKKIKLARKAKNLTQAELAEKIGLSAKQLSRIEMASFMPSLVTFLKILDVLNLDIEEFKVLASKEESETKSELLKIINCADEKEIALFYDIALAILKKR